jgi:short-subunit dehydrogenase
MKVAIITGAASGIGLALSTVCLEQNMRVIMIDKDKEKLTLESTQLKAQFPNQINDYYCDITQLDAVKSLAVTLEQNVSQIDWIFNNAGIIGRMAPLWELPCEEIHKVIEVNVYGMIHIIQSFIPLLFKQQSPSHIINMASLYAVCSGSHVASYSMSKHAVLALSESLYFDLKRLNKPVEVSVVFPSFTDTALLSQPVNNEISSFHNSLNSLLAHSRPAMDVAQQIIKEVEQKKFYIFPDKEVKGYSEERIHSLVQQAEPHLNNVEKVIRSLIKRSHRHVD